MNNEINKEYFLNLVLRNNINKNYVFHFGNKLYNRNYFHLNKEIIIIPYAENRVFPMQDGEIETPTFHHHNFRICNGLIATLNLIKSTKPTHVIISHFKCINCLNNSLKETPQFKFHDSEYLLSLIYQNISKTIESFYPNVFRIHYFLDKNEIHIQLINPIQQLYNHIKLHH